jgi:hypothetical protein
MEHKNKNPRRRKCVVCKTLFVPRFNTFQKTCNEAKCVVVYMQTEKAKNERKAMVAMRERVKTTSQWRNELQTIFNRWVRMRDAKLGCISCGRPLVGKYDAGHYYSVGAYPSLRYHPDNCHGQCVECNQHRHGNLIEYGERLTKRIGVERVEELRRVRTQMVRLTIGEIKDAIKLYKRKIKELNGLNH